MTETTPLMQGKNMPPIGQEMDRLEGFAEWDAFQLSKYFESVGLGNYSELFITHKITGKTVPLLTDSDLKEIGVNIVGDRLEFKNHLKMLQLKRRTERRTRVVWKGKEPLYYTVFDKAFGTCCYLCPDDPTQYTLTTHHLKIKEVDQLRCGAIKVCSCCCKSYQQNNIDLTQISDTDINGIPAPCLAVICCGEGREEVIISTGDEEISIHLLAGEGATAVNHIMQQVEENQVIARESGGH
mmetsp:Transcript_48213/g.94193  ORF Transcript_48213/g.94193 Transcript_48213/m.94193 type:complete len:240 (-) Transcript_48213:161-880(-)